MPFRLGSEQGRKNSESVRSHSYMTAEKESVQELNTINRQEVVQQPPVPGQTVERESSEDDALFTCAIGQKRESRRVKKIFNTATIKEIESPYEDGKREESIADLLMAKWTTVKAYPVIVK